MKRITFSILCLFFLMFFSSCIEEQNVHVNKEGTIVYPESQLNDTNHIDLLGIPLNGTSDQFIAQLRDQGVLTTEKQLLLDVNHIQYLDVDFILHIQESDENHTVHSVILESPATNRAEAQQQYRKLSKLLKKKYHRPIIVDEDFSKTAVELSMKPNRRVYATQEGCIVLVFAAENVNNASSQPHASRESDLPIYQVGIVIQDATNSMQNNQAVKSKECPSDWDKAEDGSHMTFLGVPIQGSKAEFMQQLRKGGIIRRVQPEPDEYSVLFDEKEQPYDQVEFYGIKFKMTPVVDGTPDSLVTEVSLTARFTDDSLATAKRFEALNAQLQQKYGQPRVSSNKFGSKTCNFVTTAGRVETRLSSATRASTSIINGNITSKTLHYFTIYVQVIDAQGYKKTHRY